MDILANLREAGSLNDKQLAQIIRKHNRNLTENSRHYAKKRLLPYYLKVKEDSPELWGSWNISTELERQLMSTLRIKPRRTASGVATITVITKPWKCSNECVYCPNDVRMPKSYLSDEPACQRAERNFFDPYLQVASRLQALTHMGHATDKIELIILGGTWSDYALEYQIWYIKELFRALNSTVCAREAECQRICALYFEKGISSSEEDLQTFAHKQQKEVDEGLLSYNAAVKKLYGDNAGWKEIAVWQISDFDELHEQHLANENAKHRVVGLAVETRPDTITLSNLTLLRQLGCTKIQMGIQSLNATVLRANNRCTNLDAIHQAFELLRIFGFKIHAHFMLNLLGSSVTEDKEDYHTFVSEAHYLPDEVKLYPCSLVQGTELSKHYFDESWQPYSEEDLLEVLIADALATPRYMRISRMIRDISAADIMAGNKKANLRQMVEARIEKSDAAMREIRFREISTDEIDADSLTLSMCTYETTVSSEYFLEWNTPIDRIAGFLRLSLPREDYLNANLAEMPVGLLEAMIREVHVYGTAAKLHTSEEGVQHLGLGRQLIETAGTIAREHGYTKLNVISSVGTREYYRSLGFVDNGLYQQKSL